jgi:thiamine-monophosphate kinase
VDISERDLVQAIGRVLSGAGPQVRVGVGDDAAVLTPGSGEQVLTSDSMVEGTHFVRGTTTPRDLGYKAVVASVSDIAAMAASPRAALCALTLSPEVDAAWVMELFGGMREACDEHALSLVGGDLARGSQVCLSISVLGEVAPGRAVTRSGAMAEDVLVVTGTLGGAAAGRRIGEAATGTALTATEIAGVGRFQRPAARVGEASILAANGATAMIDISDGLALDLARLCEASGVGARIHPGLVPRHDVASLEDALHGGEDYELLATLPGTRRAEDADREMRTTFGVGLTAIGEITAESGVISVEAEGRTHVLGPRGWDHFA